MQSNMRLKISVAVKLDPTAHHNWMTLTYSLYIVLMKMLISIRSTCWSSRTINEAVCLLPPLPTHPSSLALDPRIDVLIQVHGHPVCDAGDQLARILLNAFHTQHAAKCKQAHYTSPVDSVLEHLVHHALKAVVGCVRSDVELRGEVTKRLCEEQFKLFRWVPKCCFNSLYVSTWLAAPVAAVGQQAICGWWVGFVCLSPSTGIIWPQQGGWIVPLRQFVA